MSEKNHKPSPWELSPREQEIRRNYEGQDATLNNQPAKIRSAMNGKVAVVIAPRESGEVSWLMLEKGMTESNGMFRLEGGHRAVPIPPDVLKRAEQAIASVAVTHEAETAYAGRKPQEFGELSGKLLIEDLQKEIDNLRALGNRMPHDLYILFSGGVSQIKEVLDELKIDNP